MKLNDIYESRQPVGLNQLKQNLYVAIEYMGDSQQKSYEFLDAFDALADAVGKEEAQNIFKTLKDYHTQQNRTGAVNSARDTHPAERTGAVQ